MEWWMWLLVLGALLGGVAVLLCMGCGPFSQQEEAQEAAYRQRHCGGGNAG